jgi:hypothetical protein
MTEPFWFGWQFPVRNSVTTVPVVLGFNGAALSRAHLPRRAIGMPCA